VDRGLVTVERFPHATRSSMQLDYEKGGRTELELFIGYAVRTGRALAIPVPLHEEIYAKLKK
jgi:ketopantoate reductase